MPNEVPQTNITQHVDRDRGFCGPGCEHKLAIYRRGSFQPTTGGRMKGTWNYCAVVAVDEYRQTYLTACGVTAGPSSVTHRRANCPGCRRSLKASGHEVDEIG